MKSKNMLVSLVAIAFVLAIFSIANVSALGSITSIEVNEVELLGTSAEPSVAAFAGETLPVRIRFVGDTESSDTRVKVWISGARDYSVSSDRFKVFNDSVYSKLFAVTMPFDVDPQEDLTLNVLVESENGGSPVLKSVKLSAQRESYIVQILDVNMESKAKAGDNLALDIVLKNRGLEFAEDTFVRARIPALGVEGRAYFGDLAPVDQGGDVIEKDDAVERRMFLKIPNNAKAGVYNVEIEAYNGDSATTLSKKVAIVGAEEDSIVVSSVMSKSFAVGEKATYSITLVNSGNKVRVYELIAEEKDNLDVVVDESIIAVPAGTSRTVKMDVSATKAGKYAFKVDVNSDGQLVKTQTYTANIEGNKAFTGNSTVVLTVVLAIIFLVLLVVLIVLLTRKPEKTKEFGESYY